MSKSRALFVCSLLIFGSVGLFVRMASLPSSVIVLFRGAIGAVVVLIAGFLRREQIDWSAMKEKGALLLLSGFALGFNWIFLFESYHYASIAVSTICYYMAPLFVLLACGLFYGEHLSFFRLLCVLSALAGLYLIVRESDTSSQHLIGILLALCAAALYASVVLLNKSLRQISVFNRTFVQLAVSALALLPYALLTGDLQNTNLHFSALFPVLMLGIVHTGFAYLLFFSAVSRLPGSTLSVLSYIDPLFAIVLSVLFLSEPFTWFQLLGGVLILSSALFSEMQKSGAPSS